MGIVALADDQYKHAPVLDSIPRTIDVDNLIRNDDQPKPVLPRIDHQVKLGSRLLPASNRALAHHPNHRSKTWIATDVRERKIAPTAIGPISASHHCHFAQSSSKRFGVRCIGLDSYSLYPHTPSIAVSTC